MVVSFREDCSCYQNYIGEAIYNAKKWSNKHTSRFFIINFIITA